MWTKVTKNPCRNWKAPWILPSHRCLLASISLCTLFHWGLQNKCSLRPRSLFQLPTVSVSWKGTLIFKQAPRHRFTANRHGWKVQVKSSSNDGTNNSNYHCIMMMIRIRNKNVRMIQLLMFQMICDATLSTCKCMAQSLLAVLDNLQLFKSRSFSLVVKLQIPKPAWENKNNVVNPTVNFPNTITINGW